jgi:Zn-dependent protease with chaperone function
VEGAYPPTGESKMHQLVDDSAGASMVSLRAGISTNKKGVQTFMNPKNAYSSLLAALIALPMYYMFYSMFTKGFETSAFIVALILGVIAFFVTWFIASLIARSKQRAA